MLNNKAVLIMISLAVSLCLWIYVTGQVDPEKTARINSIEVSITGEEELAVQDLAVVEDDGFITSVVIQGKRSYVNKAKKEGVKAFVDVSDAKKGVNELDMEFETPTGVTVEGASEAVFSVTVEDRVSKEVPVEITFTQGASDEWEPWATAVDPETVTVSGAESQINTTERVTATIEKEDVAKTSKNIEVDLTAEDVNGQTVRGLDLSTSSAIATVQLLQTGEVELEIGTSGLDSGFVVDSISGPETVEIITGAGTLAWLKSVKAEVDLSDVDKEGIVHRKLELALPEGVYLYEEIEENVQINIKSAEE